MSGDAFVPNPDHVMTLAIDVAAPRARIWPWLVQIGYRRGGLYSYDWLDRLFGYLDRPSADRVLPEFQQLKAGDIIPMGRGPGFPVRLVEPERTLVLGGEADGVRWSWELALVSLDAPRTLLVSRSRVRTAAPWRSKIFMTALAPAAYVMTRRMLIGLKRRAEAQSGARGATARAA